VEGLRNLPLSVERVTITLAVSEADRGVMPEEKNDSMVSHPKPDASTPDSKPTASVPDSKPDASAPDSAPAEADDALRWELFNDHKKQAWADIQSSTDSYDQALLTLSSGVLGLSIAFIKEIVPLQYATWLALLYVSWVAFVLCILTTVISFQVAKATQNEHLDHCWRFYVERDDSYRQNRGKYSRALTGCTIVAGALFVLALACTINFRDSQCSEVFENA
jgi:hypothetical protein